MSDGEFGETVDPFTANPSTSSAASNCNLLQRKLSQPSLSSSALNIDSVSSTESFHPCHSSNSSSSISTSNSTHQNSMENIDEDDWQSFSISPSDSNCNEKESMDKTDNVDGPEEMEIIPEDESNVALCNENENAFHSPNELLNLSVEQETGIKSDEGSFSSNQLSSPLKEIATPEIENLRFGNQSQESHLPKPDITINDSTDLSQSCESTSSTKDTPSSSVVSHPQVEKYHSRKKMWYHVFTPSYKTRSADFKRIFKELPVEERLIVDYSCALQKEILVQGRMYVSQNFISFYANIFGWETQTSVRLCEITSITKEKTALVIPNAVQVSTENDKYFFTSFVSRDTTYVMLFKLWQSALIPNALPTKEIWKLVHACYGDELGVGSDEEAEEFLTCSPRPIIKTLIVQDVKKMGIEPIVSPVCTTEIGPAIAVGINIGSSVVTSNCVPVVTGSPTKIIMVDNLTPLPLPLPLPTDDESSDTDIEHEPIEVLHSVESIIEMPVCPVPHEQGKETVNSIIPCNVDQLFTMLFTKSKFYLDLHTARKTFDIVQSEWQQSSDRSHKVRQLSFTVTLNHIMGPKHSQVTETQTMLPVSTPGQMYAIDSESVNSGIPYADSFYVTTHFCLSRVSSNESRLIIVNQIKFRKSVWGMKTFIEKNSWTGIEEFYSHLERALKEECVKSNLNEQSPSASPRVTPTNVPRRRRKIKGQAPAIPTGVLPLLRTNRNGSIPNTSVATSNIISHSLEATQAITDSSFVLKMILSILACLLLLNAFLYIKLASLETAASFPIMIPPQPLALNQETPQSHQEWLMLLQHQESLHRIELQKWHEILTTALKILHQAEADLESLKYHIKSHENGKVVEMLNVKQSERSSVTVLLEAITDRSGENGNSGNNGL